MAKSNPHHYSLEEDKWLRANIKHHSYEKLTEMFNEKFGADVGKCSLSDRCTKQLKIKRGTNGGQFSQKRAMSGGTSKILPIRTERIHQGYVWIKIKHTYTPGKKTNAAYKIDWKEKHRYIYEQEYGAIPKGWIVIFLDGDKNNFAPSNLYAVPRSIHARMNQNHWYTDSAGHTLTAIKLCELNETIGGVWEKI